MQTAITRPVLAPDDDRRPLVLEPGGPGDPGTSFAWWFVDVLPPGLLAEFYPVGWDPRGVGISNPPIECGSFAVTDLPLAADCIAGTGDLLAHVGAADAALDLEEVRLALGVDRLDYLGFSYGTALGAVYAMAHPDRVGRFVLDGAIAPDAGDPDGPLAGHMPDYAADELDAVIARFHELCAATTECAAGPDSAALVADLATTIDTLPTDHFAGEPEQLISFDLDQLLEGATYDPCSFGLLGDALRDAADGDASTLAALVSYLIAPYAGGAATDDEADRPPPTSPSTAPTSAMSPRSGAARGCRAPTDLPVIGAVDVATPILVIGTRYDPATPGRHAAELAAALGDARVLTWEGIGHTAFPRRRLPRRHRRRLPRLGRPAAERRDVSVRRRRSHRRRDRRRTCSATTQSWIASAFAIDARGRGRAAGPGRVREPVAGRSAAPRRDPPLPRRRVGCRRGRPVRTPRPPAEGQRTVIGTPFAWRRTSSKKSLPLSSTTMNAGKSTTSIFHTASMPSSGYSSTSTCLMLSSARRAAGPPIEPR